MGFLIAGNQGGPTATGEGKEIQALTVIKWHSHRLSHKVNDNLWKVFPSLDTGSVGILTYSLLQVESLPSGSGTPFHST